MRVVVAYERLDVPAGTEVYVLTVAEQLERLGHQTTLATWRDGTMSDRARQRGLRVVRPEQLRPGDGELVVACDAASVLALAERLPDARRVMVVHSVEYVAQGPPQLEGACHAVVVLNDRTERRVRALAVRAPVTRLRQPIDVTRFRFLPRARRPLRRVAVFGHRTGGVGVEAFEDACRAAGLEPVRIGGAGAVTAEPEHLIAETDAVIGIGRCALEGIAARRPVLVAGPVGTDGWVRPDVFDAMEADGFSGRVPGRAGDAGSLAACLADPPGPEEVHALHERVHRDHDARVHAEQLVALAEGIGASGPPASAPAGPLAEMARLTRIELAAHDRVETAERAVAWLSARTEELEASLAAERARREALEARLSAVEASRRWRVASSLAAPLDRWRHRSGGRGGPPAPQPEGPQTGSGSAS